MKAVRVVITGRVQGVAYRAWTERTALGLGLDGWVRNRRDGSVEAVFVGSPAAVDAMLAECRTGPRAARVKTVHAEPLSEQPACPGFEVRGTA